MKTNGEVAIETPLVENALSESGSPPMREFCGTTAAVPSERHTVAGRILADPIDALRAVADAAGFGPQRDQLVMVVITGLSAAAQNAINLALVGVASGGKSMVSRAGQKILGPDFVATSSSIQKMTPAAMSRMGGQLTGCCIFLDERYRENSEFESLLRQAASGQRACRMIMVKGEPTELVIEPPIGIVDLALSDRKVSFQDRSRQLRIHMYTDDVTRDEITSLSLKRFTVAGMESADVLNTFARNFQVFLAGLSRDLRVVVPCAGAFCIQSQSRLRDRLLGNVLSAVCVVAWLRQKTHQKERNDKIGEYLVAEVDDYRVVYDILLACGDDGSDEVSDNGLTLFRLWSEWTKTNGNRTLRRDAFPEIVEGQLTPWQTYRALRELADLGYAVGPQGRGRVGRWQLTDLGLAAQHPSLFAALPSPEQITAQFCRLPRENEISVESTKISSLAGESGNGSI